MERNLPAKRGIDTRVTDILRDEKLPPMFRKAGLVHVSPGTEAEEQLKPDRFDKEATIAQNKKASEALGGRLAGQAARSAGLRTADPVLQHRIPLPVQALLERLPAPWAARLLLSAARRHAWTLAGSGNFTPRAGRPVVLTIGNSPLCTGLHSDVPACACQAATFAAPDAHARAARGTRRRGRLRRAR